ncbi:MAG: response regulator [Phycisphaerales bacterium]
MLILERTLNKGVCIGDHIKVRVVEIVGRGRVRLGIDAPRDVPIWREELEAFVRDGRRQDPCEGMSSLRVALVEDNPAHQKIIRRILRDAGASQVAELQTGAEAIEHLDRCDEDEVEKPDLVLLDLNLPDGSGLRVLERLRESERLRTTPVVVLSCADADQTVKPCLAAGANAFVAKSTNLDEFRRSIVRIVDFWSHARRVA